MTVLTGEARTLTPTKIAPALLFLGLYLPTSVGGVFSTALWGAWFVLLAVILSALALRKNGLGSAFLCATSVLMVAVLLGATMVSPFPDYRWGGLLGFALLGMLYATNLRALTGAKLLRTVFVTANVINITAGMAIIFGNGFMQRLTVSYYSTFYPELVEAMVRLNKPVLTFGTHSAAAFFVYLFFLMNFETYRVSKKPSDLFFALCYVCLCSAMQSFTGMALLSLALFQLLRYSAKRRPKATFAVLALFPVMAFAALQHYLPEAEDRAAATRLVTAALGSETNGILGRFSDLGTLRTTVNFIQDRPFTPVGIGYRSDLFFGDAGFVEYFLRGSVPLLIAIYLGFYTFLKQNLLSRRDVRLIFLVTIAFELGFSSLTYIRTLYLFPAFIVYLNDLRRAEAGCSGSNGASHPFA